MPLDRTSQSPYRAGFIAIAVVATCAVGSANVADTPSRRFVGDLSRVPANLGSSKNLFGESGREFYVEGQNYSMPEVLSRETTDREYAIAELRNWRHLGADWDGEGAKVPALVSLNAARAFLCAMRRDATFPEPMLLPSGRAGLYWREEHLYADLEFYESRTIAYFIERGQDRHKGVVAFDMDNIPDVFRTLLQV